MKNTLKIQISNCYHHFPINQYIQYNVLYKEMIEELWMQLKRSHRLDRKDEFEKELIDFFFRMRNVVIGIRI